MYHYRQIIINMFVDDSTKEDELLEIKSKIEQVIKSDINTQHIKDIEVKVN